MTNLTKYQLSRLIMQVDEDNQYNDGEDKEFWQSVSDTLLQDYRDKFETCVASPNRKFGETTIPLLPDVRHWFELPNGEFVLICLIGDSYGEWVVEHHDSTNEFIAGLQIDPESGRPTSTKQVASSKPRK